MRIVPTFRAGPRSVPRTEPQTAALTIMASVRSDAMCGSPFVCLVFRVARDKATATARKAATGRTIPSRTRGSLAADSCSARGPLALVSTPAQNRIKLLQKSSIA
ncbi:hypothetical protein GCM10009839_51760 [Catenulispora yoronensis]|uniref:Uncharacterized protein n=1 Tax=Catenulispora yoronensis TaxID=450799 RepID=A0ABN2UUA7_9ACTN